MKLLFEDGNHVLTRDDVLTFYITCTLHIVHITTHAKLCLLYGMFNLLPCVTCLCSLPVTLELTLKDEGLKFLVSRHY